MKYSVGRFKSLELALKEIEPFVRNGVHLQTGKPFKQLDGMLSREVLANWLLCATVNAVEDRELTFSSDPIGGDGVIEDGATGDTWPTEHVMVTRHGAGEGDAESLILKAIGHKRSKGGAAYAEGKTLVVFLDAAAGEWYPNKVARALPDPLLFATVWVVGLHGVEGEECVYGVTHLDLTTGNAPTFLDASARALIPGMWRTFSNPMKVNKSLGRAISHQRSASRNPLPGPIICSARSFEVAGRR